MLNDIHKIILSHGIYRRQGVTREGAASETTSPNRAGESVEWFLRVMIRQCLNRRVDSVDVPRAEVAAWRESWDRFHVKIARQVTTGDAGGNLKRIYPALGV